MTVSSDFEFVSPFQTFISFFYKSGKSCGSSLTSSSALFTGNSWSALTAVVTARWATESGTASLPTCPFLTTLHSCERSKGRRKVDPCTCSLKTTTQTLTMKTTFRDNSCVFKTWKTSLWRPVKKVFLQKSFSTIYYTSMMTTEGQMDLKLVEVSYASKCVLMWALWNI